jgi:hypothetical protein
MLLKGRQFASKKAVSKVSKARKQSQTRKHQHINSSTSIKSLNICVIVDSNASSEQ